MYIGQIPVIVMITLVINSRNQVIFLRNTVILRPNPVTLRANLVKFSKYPVIFRANHVLNRPILANLYWFQPFTAYSSLLKSLPAYTSHNSLVQPFCAYNRLFQTKTALPSLINPKSRISQHIPTTCVLSRHS